MNPGRTTPGSGRIDWASSRPNLPGTTTKATTAPTSIRRDPSVMAVQWKGSVRPRPNSTVPRPLSSSNAATSPTSGVSPTGGSAKGPVHRVATVVGPQCTIFDRDSSMMSIAPRSLRAGMRTLISDFGTTVSTA